MDWRRHPVPHAAYPEPTRTVLPGDPADAKPRYIEARSKTC